MKDYITFLKKYFIDNKKYIILAFFIFFFFIFLYFVIPFDYLIKDIILEQFQKKIDNINHITNYNNFKLFIYIFLNNLFVGLLLFLWGLFLSIISFCLVFFNIFILWIIIEEYLLKVSFLKIFFLLAPHWFLEIFTFLMCFAWALKFTWDIIKKLIYKEEFNLWIEIKKNFLFFCSFLSILFLIAAFIEVYLTQLFL